MHEAGWPCRIPPDKQEQDSQAGLLKSSGLLLLPTRWNYDEGFDTVEEEEEEEDNEYIQPRR